MKTVPPLNDLFNMAGLNLPSYLKGEEEKRVAQVKEVKTETPPKADEGAGHSWSCDATSSKKCKWSVFGLFKN